MWLSYCLFCFKVNEQKHNDLGAISISTLKSFCLSQIVCNILSSNTLKKNPYGC